MKFTALKYNTKTEGIYFIIFLKCKNGCESFSCIEASFVNGDNKNDIKDYDINKIRNHRAGILLITATILLWVKKIFMNSV